MKHVLIPMVIFEEQCANAVKLLKENGVEVIYNRKLPFNLSEFVERYEQIEGVICGSEPWTEEMVDLLPNLKIMARFGTGTDNIPVEALRRRNIICTNTPGANAEAVAEYALALILTLYKNIAESNELLKSGSWKKSAISEVSGKTIGLMGFGAVAKKLSRLLSGFGCHILACDPFGDPQDAEALNVALCDKEEILRYSDILSLHLPLTSETYHSIGTSELNKMKIGAILINTARGGIVDEPALCEALRCGHLKGAAVDVFEQEPAPADHPLLQLKNNLFLCSPHMGGMTSEANARTGMLAAQSVIDAFTGKQPKHMLY